jgi:hypothetical protein
MAEWTIKEFQAEHPNDAVRVGRVRLIFAVAQTKAPC